MTILFTLITIVNLLLLTVFIVYHLSFLLLYICYRIFFGREDLRPVFQNTHRFAVIIPAHNEAAIIDRLLDSIAPIRYPAHKFDVYVIADNCTDGTAQIVESRGINCLRRDDLSKQGKPYALNWVFKKIDIERHDAFTIIDADTIIDPDYLGHMDLKLSGGAEVVQGYFDLMNPDDTWLTKLMVIPGVIKFKTRYFIKDKLLIACPLMGNGMTFSRRIIRQFGWNAFSLTENWEYYAQLTLNGYQVAFAESALIYSHAVTKLSHGEVQRKRWIKGRFGVLRQFAGPLCKRACGKVDINSADALVELASPSYSMLSLWSLLTLFFSLLLAFFSGMSVLFIQWSGGLLGLLAMLLLSGLVISRAPLQVWLSLPYVPLFIIWKFYVILKSFLSLKDRSWQKTERKLD